MSLVESDLHAVPLSGGLDSRFILAELSRHLDKSKLVVVNFGIPSTYDYELPKRLCERMGIRLKQFNLRKKIDELAEKNKLIEFARRFDEPLLLIRAFINHKIQEELPEDTSVWSGYLGDPLMGSHFSSEKSSSWSGEVEEFLKNQQYSRLGEGIDVNRLKAEFFQEQPFFSGDLLQYERQLDFFVRQEGFIRKIITSPRRTAVYPFLSSSWLEFCLNLGADELKEQSFYKRFLKQQYPKFFEIGVKNEKGLPLGSPYWKKWLRQRKISLQKRIPVWGVNPMENYLDFGEYFTRTEENRDLAWTFLKEVEENINLRKVDHTPREVLERCDAGEDWGNELTQYISLGAFLKTRK